MGRSLTISEPLYKRLEAAARRRGLARVEDLLEQWGSLDDDERARRQESARRAEALRARIYAEHGEMPDSTELIRDDRGR